MTIKQISTVAGIFVCMASIGCNAGNAPAGMSETDAKNAIANMKPADRIRAIASSPMRQSDKEKEYAKIEAESGVKASEVLKSGPPPSGGG